MHSPTTVLDAASLTRLAHHARLRPTCADDTNWQHNLQVIVDALDALEDGELSLTTTTAAGQPLPGAEGEPIASSVGVGHAQPVGTPAAGCPHTLDDAVRPGMTRLSLDDLRADAVQPSLTPDQALANAPQRLGDGFGVPPVMATGHKLAT